MKSSRFCLASILLVLATSTATGMAQAAAEPAVSADAPLVNEKVRQLMQDRDYAEAASAIDEAAKAKDAPRDYLAYLKGRALYLGGKYDEAIAVFDRLAKDFPKSDWTRRARFGKAVALARQGDYRGAELIYRAEAEYLLSADRKQQIADIYLKFADVYFKPPKEDEKPDYQKALEFYKKALEVGPKAEKRIEVELLVAECHQKLGKQGEAATLYEQFSKVYPQSPLDIEARYRLGECRLAEGNKKEARRVWQDLLAKYADTPAGQPGPDGPGSPRIADAQFNLSRTWSIPQPGSDEELNLGTAALEAFIERFPKHKLASQAHLEVAESFIHRGRYEDAVKALQRFLANPRYQDRTEVADGQRLLGRAYQLQKKFADAVATWRQFLTKYPTHKAWSDVQRQIIETEYLMAAEKLQAKQYEAANKLFAEFLEKYPIDPRNPRILLAMNQKNIAEEKWDEAIAAWRRLVSKYPGTEEASRAQFSIAETLEKKLNKLEEALEEYRKVTWGSAVGEARQAIARLTAKAMTVATERVFRSDETPKLKLVSRNIESVTVRAYKVDLETYFRKMHLARGVEGLDIALIDPDKTFEFKVPKYAKYQELESAIEVPLPGDAHAGVMAVTVSSKTLETTTLVIQSDLDVLVKSSRDEVFVFAENMRTGKPWAGAKLLISNGKEVIGEATTGTDGVFQKSYKDLPGSEGLGDTAPAAPRTGEDPAPTAPSPTVPPAPKDDPFGKAEPKSGVPQAAVAALPGASGPTGQTDPQRGNAAPVPQSPVTPPVSPPRRGKPLDANDIRVFAVAAGSVASNLVNLQGVGVARGLADKGYIYTDRPAYRAGQLVNLRGCLRHAVDDAYTVEKQKKFTVEVFDSRNRLVRQEQVKLNDFGSFHTHFVLPPTSPQGRYRVLVRDNTGQNYQGTFQVHEYQLEPVRLVVDTPRRVYYRGEPIEGTIRAEFYYGAPVVNREIRYQLAGERLETATTDAKGEVRFKLPTREFSETQILPLVIQMPERSLQTAVNFVLSAQGFSIGVSSVRPVYVAGETFEVTVNTKDAEGKPIAQKLKLKVLEQTTVEGKVGERLVEVYAIETVAADGTARKTLKLDKGGRFIVRAEGTDRFKNPISGLAAVQISDEEDTVRLRILADKHTFKVGDTAAVKLHSREEPALALVAFQGARVLDYKLVQLKKGENLLEIPMVARLAPNFELAVAVMTDPRPVPLSQMEREATPVPLSQRERGDKAIVRFHSASSPFTVERDLRVKIAAKRKGDAKGPVRPGDELAVTLTATDPQGKPIAAEVSLAMIEQSLLERFPSPLPAIQDFFRGEVRQAAVRTTSSITFAYSPATQRINPRLLAEADRQELAREEEESRRNAIAAGVAMGRESSDLTMMVTPKIITQEEEEEKLGILPADAPSLRARTSLEFVEGLDTIVINGAPQDADQVMEIIKSQEQLKSATGGDKIRVRSLHGVKPQDIERALQVLAEQSGSQQQAAGRPGKPAIRYFGVVNGPGYVVASEDALNENLFTSFNNATWGLNGNGQLALNGGNFTLQLGGGNDYAGNSTISAGSLSTLVRQNPGQIVVVDNSGNMRNMKLGDNWSERKAEALAAEFNQTGAILLSALVPQETAYWNPVIATDKDGKAAVTLTVPERSTAWKLLAKGITTETLAGEVTDDLAVKKDLFGELKLPLAFTDGDEAEIIASVQNDAVDKGPIEVILKTTIGGRTVEEKKTIDVKAKGMQEIPFKATLKRPGDGGLLPASGQGPAEKPDGKSAPSPSSTPEINAEFELTVKSGDHKDVIYRAVPLTPYGIPVFATASGSATSDTTAWVEPPKDMPVQSPGMQILIGPTVERSLLDIVLGPAPWCQLEIGRIASGIESGTSDLMASLALQKLVTGSRDAASPEAMALDGRARASISLLVSSQNDDGGWSWTGGSGGSNRYASCRIVWALTLARAAGYTVPDDSYNKALGYLRNQVAATDNADYESKAILLHALSVAGQGDFALANRLYRDRPMLSNAALAYLALSFAAMDRKATAEELLGLLAARNLDDPATRRGSAKGDLPWSNSPVELRALYALALQEASPKSAKVKDVVDWLMAHRTGHRWAPDKATGPAALAVVRWFAESRFEGEHYKLAVFVNDVRVKLLEIDQQTTSELIEVPAKLLVKGRQRINFQLTGRGRYAYQCILGGFVPADKLKGTTKEWEVKRTYEPAPLELDGREIPRGFGVLEGSYTIFRNPLGQLPVGRRAQVELEIRRPNIAHDVPEERLEYLVVTEPIPSGATVVEKSVQGAFERFEIGPGEITFYVGSRRGIGTIRYELYGYLPGKYRAGPTVIRNAHRPDQIATATPKSLEVLPQGSKSSDPYRLTPQELYELGKRLWGLSQFSGTMRSMAENGTVPLKGVPLQNAKTAMGHLTELVDKWNLQPKIYKEAVQMLLDIHLELGPPAKVVHYFEIIKEKWPAEEIPFAKIVKVGEAYHEMGEYERSYLIFRATVESSFTRESGVAGFLQSQGEFLRSVDVMGRLLREYPPEPYLAAVTYALAGQVYAKAPEAANDAKLRQQKVNRVDLVRRAWTMLEGFLTAYPDDPAADQAAFAAAGTLLDMKAYKEAAESSSRYAKRYAKSDLLDSYWYIIGFCEFAGGQHKAALEMCRKVAEAKRLDKATGREVESPNKWRAIYILGQIYHSLGEAAQAIGEYRRVEDRFADAKEAIAYFLRKAIELPEVTTIKPGEPAEVELKFRNVAGCDAKVYRIDLMKFSLLKRNLAGIAQINLAGIRPLHEETVKLGDGKDYRDRTRKLPLPLKEEGAYLVVCRGDDLHASGLVLVTPLVVEIQEDAVSGRVRTTVKDVKADHYEGNVHVKVIGSRNEDFVSGSTDLRGVYVADGIRGRSTVIARAEPSRYAFFRGQTELAPEAIPAEGGGKQQQSGGQQRGEKSGKAAASPAALPEVQLLEQLQESNENQLRQQGEQLQRMYKSNTKGVESKAAF